MPFRCKDVCLRYKSKRRFNDGQKKCTTCDVFMKYDGVNCPCCGSILSTNAVTTEYRQRNQEQRMVVRY